MVDSKEFPGDVMRERNELGVSWVDNNIKTVK
jgi:hypothetical protein